MAHRAKVVLAVSVFFWATSICLGYIGAYEYRIFSTDPLGGLAKAGDDHVDEDARAIFLTTTLVAYICQLAYVGMLAFPDSYFVSMVPKGLKSAFFLVSYTFACFYLAWAINNYYFDQGVEDAISGLTGSEDDDWKTGEGLVITSATLAVVGILIAYCRHHFVHDDDEGASASGSRYGRTSVYAP